MAHVIAEVCQNHNGDVELLLEMVAAAAEAGAKYVKMQTIFSDDLTHRPRFDTGKDENGNDVAIVRPYAAEAERLSGLDLTPEAHGKFVEACREHGVLPMTTVFNRGRTPMVRADNWAGVKVASYDCASYPMLRELADGFEFMVVSTGATYDEEIAKAADVLKNTRFAFLHCVTIYPTPLDQLHLRRMDWLRQFTPLVGFSDHTLIARDGTTASKAALCYGADFVERHFTILKPDQTKDGPVSMNPEQLRDLVEFADLPRGEQARHVRDLVPDMEPLLGTEQRDMTTDELRNRDYYRGRFATMQDGEVVYNWEDTPVQGL